MTDEERRKKRAATKRARFASDPEFRERTRAATLRNAKTPGRIEYERAKGYRRSYGLTIADVERMYWEQGEKCAICKRAVRLRAGKGAVDGAAVDHDHVTGRVRGLLCGHCNRALGLLGDSADTVSVAAEYLRRHAEAVA